LYDVIERSNPAWPPECIPPGQNRVFLVSGPVFLFNFRRHAVKFKSIVPILVTLLLFSLVLAPMPGANAQDMPHHHA
jgi:hypothetical protein